MTPMNAANPMLDTATQRPATGMDRDARQLILHTLEGAPERAVLNGFLTDRYANVDDYSRGVREVWGDAPADRMNSALTRAINEQSTIVAFGDTQRAEERAANAVLLYMPEPDFRGAVFEAVRQQRLAASPVERITSICRRRGIPWEFTASEGFRWIGDAEVETSAMRPALSAVEDPRLLGARSHFDAARSELALGTPTSLRQSVHESACAVEGAMKVLLTQRGVPYDEKDAAFKLFDHLVNGEIVPRFMEYCVLAAASPRNKRGGHGAGEAPHDVPQEIAEAVIAASAVAVSYLCKLLP
jgi:hypothetical protein